VSAQIIAFPGGQRFVSPPRARLAYDLDLEVDKLAELVAARAIEKRQKAEAFQVNNPGAHGTIDAVLRIVAWAMSHRQLPSAHAFMERWGMSRATAYRYRARLTNSGLTPRSH